jgi:hypothetical protein
MNCIIDQLLENCDWQGCMLVWMILWLLEAMLSFVDFLLNNLYTLSFERNFFLWQLYVVNYFYEWSILNNSIVFSFEEIDFYDDFKSSKFLENVYIYYKRRNNFFSL